MRIYRVEDEQGLGPYSNGHAYRVGLPIWDGGERHPGPQRDGKLANFFHNGYGPPDFRFGFKSQASLRRWFSKEDLAALAELGSTVSVYRVPKKDVIEGHKQVAFFKPGAEKLGEWYPVNEMKRRVSETV